MAGVIKEPLLDDLSVLYFVQADLIHHHAACSLHCHVCVHRARELVFRYKRIADRATLSLFDGVKPFPGFCLQVIDAFRAFRVDTCRFNGYGILAEKLFIGLGVLSLAAQCYQPVRNFLCCHGVLVL